MAIDLVTPVEKTAAEKNRERVRAVVARRRAVGMCLNCGKPPRPSLKTCEKCAGVRAIREARRRAEGVCIKCADHSLSGSYLCEKHLGKKREADRKLFAKRAAKGLCKTCDNPRVKGKLRCVKCLARFAAWKVQSDAKRRASGVCVSCGKVPPVPGHVQCTICYVKKVASDNFGSVAFAPALLDMFGRQNGRCPYSGRALTLGIDADLDHIHPLAKGGAVGDLRNVQWVWNIVNGMKRDMMEPEFISIIRMIHSHFVKGCE